MKFIQNINNYKIGFNNIRFLVFIRYILKYIILFVIFIKILLNSLIILGLFIYSIKFDK